MLMSSLQIWHIDKTNNPSFDGICHLNAVSFKLFFSFDYAGHGPWDQEVVIDLKKNIRLELGVLLVPVSAICVYL
jgi:hypothetical protein